jgi:hypothetical protein
MSVGHGEAAASSVTTSFVTEASREAASGDSGGESEQPNKKTNDARGVRLSRNLQKG